VAELGDPPWNEVIADRRDHLYVNDTGFDFAGGGPEGRSLFIAVNQWAGLSAIGDGA